MATELDRAVLTQDHGFSGILALTPTTKPSLVSLRLSRPPCGQRESPTQTGAPYSGRRSCLRSNSDGGGRQSESASASAVTPSDGMDIGKLRVPRPSGVFAEPWSAKKALGLLAVFGPAAIVASVSIGAGETIVVVRAGAWARYGLLWLVLLSCVVKGVFVTYLLGRYTAVSGEHIGHRLVRLPGPRGWLLLAIVALEMIGAPLAWVPIAKPCGDLFHFLLSGVLPAAVPEPIYENLITCLFIACALAFGLRLSFEKLEKQQIAICSILVVGTLIGTLMVRPDLGAGAGRQPQLRQAARVPRMGTAGRGAESTADDGDRVRLRGRLRNGLRGIRQLGRHPPLGNGGTPANRGDPPLRVHPRRDRLPARRSATGSAAAQERRAAALGRRHGRDRAVHRHRGVHDLRRRGAVPAAKRVQRAGACSPSSGTSGATSTAR